MGFANREHQGEWLTLRPINTVSPGNLAAVGNTVIAKFSSPKAWGTIQLIAMGFSYAADGGAQTTAGTMRVDVNGTSIKTTATGSTVRTLASTASHSEGDVEEVSFNYTASADAVKSAPAYPEANAGDLIEAAVDTQGAGAGDQTVFPYLIVRIKWPQ